MNAITQPAMFRRASRDMGALIAKLQAIGPMTEMPLHPLPVHPKAVGCDCMRILEAAVECIRARMQDIEYSTGVDMETKAVDWITVAFTEECAPMFQRAADALADAAPPAIPGRPGIHGRAP